MGGRLRDGREDRFDDAVEVRKHAAVPETQHGPTARRKISGAIGVGPGSLDVLRSVQLDRNPHRATSDVNDEVADH